MKGTGDYIQGGKLPTEPHGYLSSRGMQPIPQTSFFSFEQCIPQFPLQYGTVKHPFIFHDGKNTVQAVSGKYSF